MFYFRVLLSSQNVHVQNKILSSHPPLISIGIREEVAAFSNFPVFGEHDHSLVVPNVKTL